jgi:dipeptidyl aminopeptidase/acylaminoacyl peptidase
MQSPRFPLLLAAICLVTLTLGAAEPAAKRAITAEDLWAVKRPGALELSPDGSRLVFTVQEFNLEKNNSTKHLWLLDTATGATRALTTADSSDNAPTWSPDGSRIAFTSKRGADEQPSLYVIRADGGEAEKILELPLPVSAPHWLPDGKRIVFATNVLPKLAADPEAMKKELKKQKDRKVTAKTTENGFYRFFDTWFTEGQAKHLMLVDLATKKTTDLTPKWDRAFRFDDEVQYDVSPDGKWIALCAGTTPPPFREAENNDIYLLSTENPSAPWKNLTTDNVRDDEHPKFSPDGAAVVFARSTRDHGLAEFPKLMRVELASGNITRLAADADLAAEDWHFSHDGRTLFFRAEDRGRTKIFSTPASGGPVTALVSEATNGALTVGERQMFFLRQSFTRPDEVYSCDLTGGAATVRSHFNDELFAQLKLGKVEELSFTGAAGDSVQLWVIYPPDFDPAKKYPLLQLMHGGPATMIGDIWQPRWNAQVFVTPGYVATWVNRHGSTGFGEKFVQSIDGAWGEKPFEDIMRATDFLLGKYSFLDANRMAALGASYGGYMASWVCGHTNRFKAIVCHAGVSDFDTQYASDVANYWQDGPMGGSPWQRTAAYDKENPMNYAANFKTPTLVIHGGTDYRVPADQGLEFYAALQAQSVPARLVFFPDENHWVLHAQNSVFWYGEVRDWLGRWLSAKSIAAASEPAAAR